MVLGKKVAIFDGNGAENRSLEKGRKYPAGLPCITPYHAGLVLCLTPLFNFYSINLQNSSY